MNNFIRACFCISSIQSENFYYLLKTLDDLNCKYNYWKLGSISGYLLPEKKTISIEEQVVEGNFNPEKSQRFAEWLATPGHLNLIFHWKVNEKLYIVRLLKNSSDDNQIFMSFDIEENIFFKENEIEFVPNDDTIFKHFKQIIIQILHHTKPNIGVIDYEADLICTSLGQNSYLASWGNYFSQFIFEQLTTEERQQLLQTVDEHIQVKDLGVLTFIHPLAVNQAWTTRHKQLEMFLKQVRLLQSDSF